MEEKHPTHLPNENEGKEDHLFSFERGTTMGKATKRERRPGSGKGKCKGPHILTVVRFLQHCKP